MIVGTPFIGAIVLRYTCTDDDGVFVPIPIRRWRTMRRASVEAVLSASVSEAGKNRPTPLVVFQPKAGLAAVPPLDDQARKLVARAIAPTVKLVKLPSVAVTVPVALTPKVTSPR